MSALREQLEAAITQHSEPTGEVANDNVEAPQVATSTGGESAGGDVAAGTGPSGAGDGTESAAQVAQRLRDERGRFAPKLAANDNTERPKQVAGGDQGGGSAPPGPAAAPESAPAPQAETYKPPQSWKPQAREHWSKLAPEVQAEVSRREREIALALQETAEPRKFVDQFRQVVAPFEGMIRAEGGDPLGVVSNMLQTAAALRMAPPQHKAVLVANMVKSFGIPIEALDQALAGQSPGPQQATPYQPPSFDPDTIAQKVRQDVLREMDAKRAQEKLEAFRSSHEFFDDVQADMQLLIERGYAKSLDDAYNRAVQMNPDVSAAIQQRERAKAGTANPAAIQRSKAAASSVRPSPAAAPSAQPQGLREQLEAAIAATRGR
jgi:hypothetical protein